MKKNLISIIILALGLINFLLTAIIMFAVVPTTIKTNNLIAKVASSIDLELQTPVKNAESNSVDIADIAAYDIPDDITINLASSPDDTANHYALISASLSLNSKSKDYGTLEPKLEANVNAVKEIISDTFSEYTAAQVKDSTSKDKIKAEILKKLQDKFQSDFIVDISFGKLVVE